MKRKSESTPDDLVCVDNSSSRMCGAEGSEERVRMGVSERPSCTLPFELEGEARCVASAKSAAAAHRWAGEATVWPRTISTAVCAHSFSLYPLPTFCCPSGT